MSYYDICVRGQLSQPAAARFKNLTVIRQLDGNSCLRAKVGDLGVLFSIYAKIASLGLSFISIKPVDIEKEIIANREI